MLLDGKKLCIVGTGGFGRETLLVYIDSVKGAGIDYRKTAVFMVDDNEYCDTEVMGIPVIKRSAFNPENFKVVVGIGDPVTRKRMVESLSANTAFISLIHPSAVISEFVKIGVGSIVTAGVIVTCNISIGRHAQLNLHSTIGHDCVIGDFFTTAPGAKISGICEFGECVYFGTNASVRQGIKICDSVTIGMGGVVVKNVDEAGIYIGNPVQRLNR